jgi:class 3 adenylate cyclase/tetratricopeptide (TPR) repeat protein
MRDAPADPDAGPSSGTTTSSRLGRNAFAPYVSHLLATWTGPPAKELDGTLVSVDISGFTALSERLEVRGRAGAEELVVLISEVFAQLVAICDRHGGDVLEFRGDALLVFFSAEGHDLRAYVTANEMKRLIEAVGSTMSSVGPVTLRMRIGVCSGSCQFFVVDGTHRELIVAGSTATETIRLEAQAASNEIVGGGPVPSGTPEPYAAPRIIAADNLERFVPASLRMQLGLDGEEPEHRQVTAAFLRFSGAEELLASGGLEALHTELARLAQLIGAACAQLGVAWLKSDIEEDGGKLFLVAGAPASTGEDEERMLRVLRRVLDEYRRAGGVLALHAGVNRGNAFCGDIGGRSRRTYAVMGDIVNVAARLAARAEPGGILATPEVLDRARTRYEVSLEPLLLKGKDRPITAFHVAAPIGTLDEAGPTDTSLIGRDAEIASLAQALSAARMRHQRVVEIVGEPGIGKSRLVRELQRQAVGFVQLVTQCEPYASASPYFALRALLRPIAGITRELDEPAAGAQLTAWVDAVLLDLAPWLPLLAIPFGAEVPPTPETEQIDPSFRRERLLEAVEQFLDRVLMMPTLLVIEDIHWADDASLELIRHLVRHAAPRPWLLCITRRRHQGEALARVTTEGQMLLDLERLGEESTRSLALLAAGETALTTEALGVIRKRSGGNPLFIRELVRAARTTGSVHALPETVERVITSRIDTISPEDRFLLRNASALGTRFELDVLGEVLAGALGDVADGTRWQRLSEFVTRDADGNLRFVHDLFRMVCYEGMSFARRRDVHVRVSDVLERRGADPALLSLHFIQAGRYEQAWESAKTAGDRARSQYANVDAAELYQRALAAADHLHLPAKDVARVYEALGDVCWLFAANDRASDAFARARELVGDLGSLLLKEGRIRERHGFYEEALEWCERGAAVAENDETRIELDIFQAGVLFRQARYDESIQAARRAVDHAQRAGERAALAHACSVLDSAQTHLGRFDPIWNERALALYEELGDLKGQGTILNNVGIHAYYAGRWTDALDLYRRSWEAKQRSGDVEGAALVMNNEAEILSDQGHFARAEALFDDALRIARATGFEMVVAFVTANLGRVAARTRRFEIALVRLDEAAEKLHAIGSEGLALEVDVRRAECLALQGRHRECRELSERALVRAEEMGRLNALGPSLERALGYALHQSRRQEEGAIHFERSLHLARETQARYEIGLTLQAIAAIIGQTSPEAEELLEQLGVVSVPSVPLP